MKELLEKVIRKSIEEKEVAGVSLLIQRNGKEICFLTEGMADRENHRKIERDTIFRIYSQTKPVCAAAAMILMERGDIDLCQPLSEILPGFRNQNIYKDGTYQPVKREIQIHDLLQMTSGICYPDTPGEGGKNAAELFGQIEVRRRLGHPVTTMEFANAMGGCALAFEPGSSWTYGASADVLGAVIEEVSGKSLGTFMEQEIFAPLGMKDTGFWVPPEKQNRLARIYKPVAEDGEKRLIRYEENYIGIDNRMDHVPAYESGGAGLVSTLGNYMRFARMLLNNGLYEGRRILKENTVRYLTGGQLSTDQQKAFEDRMQMAGHSYGNLMSVCRNKHQAAMLARAGEYGWGGWLGTYFANFPEEKMTILIGMQLPDTGAGTLARKLRNIILSSGEVSFDV